MKNVILSLFIAVLFSPILNATNSHESLVCMSKDTVYETVDVYPEFPGGMEALIKFFNEGIKYPEEAKKNNEQAKLFMKFVVNQQGQVEDIVSLKDSKPYFVDEAKRLFRQMPRWKAGELNGKKVKVMLVLPISFKL